jgi:hypothetical protein
MVSHVDVRLNRVNIRNLSVRAARRLIEEVTTEVEIEAKVEAMGPYATGDLAASIMKEVWVEGRTVHGRVRAHDWKANLVHDGARPHRITPRMAGGHLRFYWRKVGQVVTFSYVNHPGMRGKKFLSKPMERVGRRHRFIVFSTD